MDEALKNACIAFSCGDSEELLPFMAENIEWKNIGKETIKGKAAIEEICRQMQMQPVYLQASSQFESINHLVVEGHGEAENEFSFCDIFHFEQHKVVGINSYLVRHEEF
ncbi:nuclear transport factor 2 family protein [Vibrio sp. SCSIO 43136]|uniref:nuclear transport factor 2 family protein n=1 Tax=Vibrio sp. SCSIO 43136 TaxID=2819101 RepID=UPI002076280C|nr:nuclear transport factor 2 family protein [Vibrio sp. SCSIO 43136]USD67651.1 nuclear transport factor 2 family protein [Vibrio sp. SCSIO 43136]